MRSRQKKKNVASQRLTMHNHVSHQRLLLSCSTSKAEKQTDVPAFAARIETHPTLSASAIRACTRHHILIRQTKKTGWKVGGCLEVPATQSTVASQRSTTPKRECDALKLRSVAQVFKKRCPTSSQNKAVRSADLRRYGLGVRMRRTSAFYFAALCREPPPPRTGTSTCAM